MNSALPITALIIDAGNTKVRIVGWQGGDQDLRLHRPDAKAQWPVASPLVDLAVLPTPDKSGALARTGVPFGDLPVVLTSVVPAVADLVRSLWPHVSVIDHSGDLPFRVLSARPQDIGPDRLCNVAAATACGLSSALIVDAGTATTFDVLADGEFQGGLIAPGMALAAQCLGEFAARLESIPFAKCPLEPGLDTAAAMQAGAFHAGVGGVQAVIQGLQELMGPLPVVFTGGLGGLLAWPEAYFDPYWTLRGAVVISGAIAPPVA